MEKTQINFESNQEFFHSAWLWDLKQEKLKKGYYYLPDNFSEIIIVLEGEIVRKVIGTRRNVTLRQGNIYMASVRSRGVIFQSEGSARLLILKICPLAKVISEELHTEEIGSHIVRLSNNLLQGYWQVKPTEIIRRLVSKFYQQSGTDSLISRCINLIKENGGDIMVKEIYDAMGVCKSTLEDRFQKALGISPKEYCKIEKLNRFMENYTVNQDMSLTQLTFKSGYYDQSHLIKEFKYFVDISPRKFLRDTYRMEMSA